MKNDLEVVWIPRDDEVKSLLERHVNREIDYLTLTREFRERGWSIGGLFEVLVSMENEKKKYDNG